MFKHITRIAFAVLFLLSVSAYAEPTGFRAYQLPRHGSLQLSVPRSWNDQMRQRQEDSPPTVLFTPESGYRFNVQLTVLWPTEVNAVMPGADEIRLTVAKLADDVKSKAVETDIPVQEIHGTTGIGYYFSLSDRAPGAGEFKYMTKGMLREGDLVLIFVILSNDGAGSAVKDALDMIKSTKHIGAVPH